ncbi:MAG: phospholipid carrier-dependent glycosyltransferase [Nevskiaceae bacterium]|nr:MAG: phospholipid carrier-dependent glycosyltransferase [Nevskiaceae bacterium]TBR73659.1 MAG: phospholipid carrier-dependent glycosyltransferase [Nevskiaceae bacterium]
MPEIAVRTDHRWLIRTLVLIAVLTLYRGLVLGFGHLDLYVDEAQYWTWAKDLDWGYYSKPPVLALLIALTTWVGGNSVFWVKAGALLVYPLSALLIHVLARRLFDARIAFWSAAAFLLLPGVSFSSLIISTDVPFFLFWCLALYAYWRALEADEWRWWLVAGFAGGMGLQTKYTMILFVVCMVLHLATDAGLRRHFRNPRLYTAMAIAAAIFLPNLLWNAAHGWPTLIHTEQISHLETNAGLHWNHLGEFFGSQFAVMGPVFFAAWLWLTFARPTRWWNDPRLRFLALFAIPFLGVICLQALAGRANANWGAMTYASATVFIVAIMAACRPTAQRWIWRCFAGGLVLNAALMPVAYHFDTWTRVAGITLTAHTDPYKRVRGWAEFGRQAQVYMQAHATAIPLADDRATVAELMYYARPEGARTLEWNPAGNVHDQYTLTPTLDDKQGHDFLYFTGDDEIPAAMRRHFATVTPLGAIHVPIHADWALDYRVWLLQGFSGY